MAVAAPSPEEPRSALWPPLVALAAAAGLVALQIASGGFRPLDTGIAAVAVLVALALAAVLAPTGMRPGPLGFVALLAFGGLAVWTLASGEWSGSAARATLEYQRALLYVGLLALCACLPRRRGMTTALAAGLLAGGAGLCAVALALWFVPGLATLDEVFRGPRLSWPTSYWNASGLLGALVVAWGLGLGAGGVASRAGRALAVAAVPLGLAVIWLSASRGSALAVVLGAAVAVALGTPRHRLATALAALPAAVLAVLAVAATDAGEAAAGEHEATLVVVALAAVVAGVLRGLLDGRVAVRLAPRTRTAALAGGALAVAVAAVAFAPALVDEVSDRTTAEDRVRSDVAPGERFLATGTNDRLEQWRIALEGGFERERLHGTGAGTYPLIWARDRDTAFTILDAHSLPVEVLAELGVVGAVLLVTGLLALLAALVLMARRAHGPWAALAGGAVAWAAVASVDWMWELPALTAWVFAAGGLAASQRRPGSRDDRAPLALRVAIGAVALALALTPLAVARSQSALDAGVRAYDRGRCGEATREALRAARALRARPEPLELLAYCELRRGRAERAERIAAAAVRRDPGNWELHYLRALALAADLRDPAPAVRATLARNPRHRTAQLMAERLGEASSARERRRRALALPALVPSPR